MSARVPANRAASLALRTAMTFCRARPATGLTALRARRCRIAARGCEGVAQLPGGRGGRRCFPLGRMQASFDAPGSSRVPVRRPERTGDSLRATLPADAPDASSSDERALSSVVVRLRTGRAVVAVPASRIRICRCPSHHRVDASTLSQQSVFQYDRRFIIPVCQRPYVWDHVQQWEPLRGDVEAVALRLSEGMRAARAKGVRASEADKSVPPRFPGALGVEPHRSRVGEIDVRCFVDGRHRPATFQRLLRATVDAVDRAEPPGSLAARVRTLIRDEEEIVSGDEPCKVRPRPAEKLDDSPAMSPTRPPGTESRFAEARACFFRPDRAFLAGSEMPDDPHPDEDPMVRRASRLAAMSIARVAPVVIDLDDVDDAREIFDALNARNTPLSATDLVKNLLVMRVQAAHRAPQELYDEGWARFDRDAEWWQSAAGAGHAKRARQDGIPAGWPIAQLGRVIHVGRLYCEFRRGLDRGGLSPVDAPRTLELVADAYETLPARRPGATPAEVTAFGTIQRLNITAATPAPRPTRRTPASIAPRDGQPSLGVVCRATLGCQVSDPGLRVGPCRGSEGGAVVRGPSSRGGGSALRGAPHRTEWPGIGDMPHQLRQMRL